MDFPMVVGCDLDRAKAIIRTRLGYYTPVNFVVAEYKPTQRNKPVTTYGSNTIVLWYDAKYDAVALTPHFRGAIVAPPPRDDDTVYSE